MCDPITALTVATVGIGAMSAVSNAQAQGAQAKANQLQAEAQAEANNQTNANALAQARGEANAQAKINAEERQRAGTQQVAANENFSQADQNLSRENAMLSGQESENTLTLAVQQAQAFGKIANSASSAGIGASTTHAFLSASAAGYNRAVGISETNFANKRAALQSDYVGADITRQTSINNISPETIFAPVLTPTKLPTSYALAPGPSALATGLNIAGAVVGGATTYKALGGNFGLTPAATGVG